MPYVRVHVEASEILEELDDDALIEEMKSRNLAPIATCADLTLKLWEALYTGHDARALEIARELAEQATGRMVPRPPQLRRVA